MPKIIFVAACTAAFIGAGSLVSAGAATSPSHKPGSGKSISAFMQKYDANHNGSLSLQEATTAAEARFAALDPDHDGTIDAKEAIPAKISTKDFKGVDPDKDNLLQKDEYLNLVQQKFAVADTAHNGELTSKELNSKAGRALMLLLR